VGDRSRTILLAELDAGLLSLLGAVVATSVFTIGFVSHRSHVALISAREALRADPSATQHAQETVADAQSRLVLFVNLGLAGLAAVTAFFAARHDNATREDWVTLGGFLVLEAAVIGLGLLDHAHVRRRVEEVSSGKTA
jgi:hypothetical protein